MTASFIVFSGTQTRQFHLKEGEAITFQYELQEKKGELTAILIDSGGKPVIDFPAGTGEKKAVIAVGGTHTLKINGKGARGSYSFEWSID